MYSTRGMLAQSFEASKQSAASKKEIPAAKEAGKEWPFS